ncbi:unnamed protein product [Calypogeia fissa]
MTELYSVWALAPSEHPGLRPATEHLQRIYGGPNVEPHVTVLGSVPFNSVEEGAAKLQDLARSLKPITYRIRGVDQGRSYFQCLFLTVDPTPQVLEANAQAKRVFKVAESQNAYFPHLSLLYGGLTDEDKKKGKALAEEKFGDILVNSEFVVSSLTLWTTDTEDKLLTSWKKVAEFPLQGGGS